MKKLFTKLSSLFAICCLLFIAPIYAQDLKISAGVSSKRVALGEQLRFTISFEGESLRLPPLKLPELPGFDIYSSGTSQNVSIINGKITSTFEYNYVLVPKKAGKLTIPSLSIKYKGKTYTTQPIEIEVVRESSQQQEEAKQRLVEKSFFAEQKFNKTTCYIGEPVYYTFSFYADRMLAKNPSVNLPDFSNFITEDFPPKNYQKIINGKRYFVSELKIALIPIKEGTYRFPEASLTIQEWSFPSFFDEDFFGDFFGGGQSKTLTTQPLVLKVVSLPEEGKPLNYKGDIGNFKIKADIDKKELKVREPITLSIKIYGEGNISSISQPDFPALPNFKQYEVISSKKIKKENYVLEGEKTFQTILVPGISGELKIPSIEYSFFNPQKKKYQTLSTKEFSIKVLPSPKEKKEAVLSLKEISRDIRYLAEVKKLKKSSDAFSKNFAEFLAAPWILFFVFLVFKLKFFEKLLPKSYITRKSAFLKAKSELDKEFADKKEFFERAEKALKKFICDRMGIEKIDSVERTLSQKISDKSLVGKTVNFVKKLQALRFSNAPVEADIRKTKQELLELLKELQRWI